MAFKIYISPSSQRENTYASGNTNEAVQCRRIAVALAQALIRCGFETLTDSGESSTMYTRVAQSNIWGADLHVPIHTNAFDGSMQGTRLFCLNVTGEGYKAAKAIFDALSPIVPGTSDGIRAAGYYEIVASRAPCAYVEAAFHDHEVQALWIMENTLAIAEAICKGICAYFGVSYVPGQERVFYRVQVGAFRDRGNADSLADKLKKEGYEAFVTQVKETENG